MTQDKTIITCALTGVLTNPAQHPVPVTPEQMAASAKEAYDAGAAVVHVHFRRQEPGMGHLPTWDPDVAAAICDAIREACPKIVINMSTGVLGPDVSGPIACMQRVRPEIAACNAGTLNYLKVRKDGRWAWPPMVFDNPVEKVQKMLDAMKEVGARPEFECFDTGIVRSVGLYVQARMTEHPEYNFVMGVASGMPADPDLLPILLRYVVPGSPWQVTAIGRAEVWPLHRRAAELGGHVRTGLEDTFYLPDGTKASGNGVLVEALARIVRETGREIASPDEARAALRLASSPSR
ncbi:MAG: 3-keto-5-aminohexanoate cleavage protein [Deltaproteobacteria bacterium]|nr:MAG: 3-keto-5-aminohexanoate cleavage protein [Deltaproteobacteria bacterium]